jgi:hypothetical protein
MLRVTVVLPPTSEYSDRPTCEIRVPVSYAEQLRAGGRVRVTIERLP